jgi:hypothetical protein
LKPCPCPFCGDPVGDAAFWFCCNPAPPESYNVFCLECEFDGPKRATLDEAVAAWNRRSPGGDDGWLERAARIIDPDAWHNSLWLMKENQKHAQAEALSKARAIAGLGTE